jgi:hypothetical protein
LSSSKITAEAQRTQRYAEKMYHRDFRVFVWSKGERGSLTFVI